MLDFLRSRTATHVNDEDNEAQVTQYDSHDFNDGKTKKRIAPASKSRSTRKKRQKTADFDDGGLGEIGVVGVTENAPGTGRGELVSDLVENWRLLMERCSTPRSDIPEHTRIFNQTERSRM